MKTVTGSLTVRILLAGHGVLTHALLQALLINTRCDVVGVFLWSNRTQASVAAKRYDHASRRLVRKAGVGVIRCNGINDPEFQKRLHELNVDCVLVGSWGEKLNSVLATENTLFVNCHPSLLPKHRGANPYFTTILAGDAESGVSFHLIDNDYDTGPLILQKNLIVDETDSGYSLRQRCSELAASMIDELVDKLIDPETMELTPQKELGAPSYSRQVTQEDALIGWNKNASHINRQIRAVMPWCQANFSINRSCRMVVSFAYTRHAKQIPSKRGTVMEITNDMIWINAGDQDIGFKQPRVTVSGIVFSWAWSKPLLQFLTPVGTVLPGA